MLELKDKQLNEIKKQNEIIQKLEKMLELKEEHLEEKDQRLEKMFIFKEEQLNETKKLNEIIQKLEKLLESKEEQLKEKDQRVEKMLELKDEQLNEIMKQNEELLKSKMREENIISSIESQRLETEYMKDIWEGKLTDIEKILKELQQPTMIQSNVIENTTYLEERENQQPILKKKSKDEPLPNNTQNLEREMNTQYRSEVQHEFEQTDVSSNSLEYEQKSNKESIKEEDVQMTQQIEKKPIDDNLSTPQRNSPFSPKQMKKPKSQEINEIKTRPQSQLLEEARAEEKSPFIPKPRNKSNQPFRSNPLVESNQGEGSEKRDLTFRSLQQAEAIIQKEVSISKNMNHSSFISQKNTYEPHYLSTPTANIIGNSNFFVENAVKEKHPEEDRILQKELLDRASITDITTEVEEQIEEGITSILDENEKKKRTFPFFRGRS